MKIPSIKNRYNVNIYVDEQLTSAFDKHKWNILLDSGVTYNELTLDSMDGEGTIRQYYYRNHHINKWLEENQIDPHNMSDEDIAFMNMRFSKPSETTNSDAGFYWCPYIPLQVS